MLRHRIRFADTPADHAYELRLEGRYVLAFNCHWKWERWVPASEPFGRAMWDFNTHAISVSEQTMSQSLVDAANHTFGSLMREAERPRQTGLFANACCVCGADRNTYPETAVRDGYGNICETRGKLWVSPDEPIRTPCHVCDRLVCRLCILTVPNSFGHQFYHHTYCSEACRQAAPANFAGDDDYASP